MNAHLYRLETSEHGTFGCVIYRNMIWHTLELPNRDNKRNLSNIPTGEYTCVIRFSPHFRRNTFHLQDVEGRTYILIHSANFAGDTTKGFQSHLNGCIALGKSRGKIKNKHGKYQKAVLNSRTAVREFMEVMENKQFQLTIKEF